MTQDQGASARADRAATPSEPSQSSVVSGVAGIPCAFTPGPWEARTFAIYGGERLKDRIAHTGGGLAPSRVRESEANAHLIAAAPELCDAAGLWAEYDALLKVYSGPQTILFDGDAPEIDAAYDKAISATVAALAKARGQ